MSRMLSAGSKSQSMCDNGKRNVLGVCINVIDYDSAVARIISAARKGMPLAVTALAVHGVMTGVLDAEHRYRLNRLDLVVPDGQPVRWALNLLYRASMRDRVYGPTLTLRVCEQAARDGLPVFLYGSRSEVLEALCRRLKARFPTLIIAGAQPSRFRNVSVDEKYEIAYMIRASGARITFVGLGCPRQEVWVYEHVEHLSMPLLAVGAAFDFHAGLLPQAPRHLQDFGLEWLFRLLHEPRRLWKRYLYLNPLYLLLIAAQAVGVLRFPTSNTRPPTGELRYG
jgi:N-acetylglucosaminyldiphosphoundecaprenol N-acetyl-beta-D-mannosaminyltransferase